MNLPADRHLLFGLFALQNDFLSREDLLDAVHGWLIDKARPLDQALLERGILSADEHALLAALMQKHLNRHGGDIEKSLAALSSLEAVRDALQGLDDPKVAATLAHIATQAYTPGSGQLAENNLDGIQHVDPYATVRHNTNDDTRFRIVRPHAKGGLGEVFVARDRELNREVALKQIQSQHLHNEACRFRFLLEAEITGNLEHPGIVPVYGLGHYADGRPFYAMRFIRGDSLKEAVDRFFRTPGANQRDSTVPMPRAAFSSLVFRKLLGQFIDVCNAIEYAHSRGVLHRDLKPGNIMLGKYGETLVVDWGLAKTFASGDNIPAQCAEEQRLPLGGRAATLMGSVIGTPAFMSPEQAAGRIDNLGPASDVYSLGATLYYVLTGQAPFDARRREADSQTTDYDLGEVLRKVQAGEFPPPRSIHHAIPAALQSICLKAMSVQSGDRHATPRALADDIERFLADEPVSCHRESLPTRLRRWGRRHRAAVASAAAAMVVLLAALASGLALAARHNQELVVEQSKTQQANQLLRSSIEKERIARLEAQVRQKQAEDARANESQARREAESVTNYLVKAFRSPDPGRDGRSITIAEVLDRSIKELQHAFPSSPRTKATLLNAIGSSYQGLGLYKESVPIIEQARGLHLAELGPDHPETLSSMNALASAYSSAGKIDEALELSKQTLSLRQSRLGSDHPATLDTMALVAEVYRMAGRLDMALPLFEATLQSKQKRLGPTHPDTLTAMNNLANGYRFAGEVNRALPLYEKVLALFQARLGRQHPNTLVASANLAEAYRLTGQSRRALPLYEETLKLMQAKLGPDHPDTITSMNNLALGYNSAGQPEQAHKLYEESLKLSKDKLGPEHPHTLMAMNNLANSYVSAGRLEQALAMNEETLKIRQKLLGTEHPDTLASMHSVAAGYWSAGNYERAVPLFEQTLELRKARLGPRHPDTLLSMHELATSYRSFGELERAVPLYEQTLKLKQAEFGAKHPSTLATMNHLAHGYLAEKDFTRAIPLYEQTLELRRTELGPEHPDTLNSMNNLAEAYRLAGQIDRALPLFKQSHERLQSKLGSDHPDTLFAANRLALGYESSGDLERALPLFEATLASQKGKLGPEHPDTLKSMHDLAHAYDLARQFDRAAPLYEETLKLRTGRYGPTNPETLATAFHLAGAYLSLDNPQRALPLMESYVAAQRRRSANKPISLAEQLCDVSRQLIRHRQLTLAEDYLREALAILEEHSPEDWRLFDALSLQGAALSGQKKFAQAEPLLLRGQAGLKQRRDAIPPGDETRLNEALQRLVDLYDNWEKPEEAARWREELADPKP